MPPTKKMIAQSKDICENSLVRDLPGGLQQEPRPVKRARARPARSNPTGRRWAFTVNNPTAANYAEVYALLEEPSSYGISYIIVGEEVAASGTLHLQGYLHTVQPVRQTQLEEQRFDSRGHWGAAREDADHNRTYCSKGGNFLEGGSFPSTKKKQGEVERERWEEAKRMAIEGNLDDIPGDIYVRYYSALCKIAKDHLQKAEDLNRPCGVWYHGKAGAGKSTRARREHPVFYYKLANKWWDGYQNEETVLIEDLDVGHKVLGHQLKLWADEYAFSAEVKGGMINIRPKTVIVTSQYTIREIFGDDEKTVEALERRYRQIEVIRDWADEADVLAMEVVAEREQPAVVPGFIQVE